MKVLIYRILLQIAPNVLFRFQHYLMHSRFGNQRYVANLSEPKTFNEFTLKQKNALLRESYGSWVDKYAVKNKISEKVGPEILIPTMKHFNGGKLPEADDISFPCILKPTHLSGYTRVFKTKADFYSFDLNSYWGQVSGINFYHLTGERQYKAVEPAILFEPLIQDTQHEELKDYKIFCFGGKPKFIQVDLDRKFNHTRTFYDLEWSNQRFSSMYPIYEGEVEKPKNLDEMLRIAEELAKPFTFVRVDLYNVSGKVLFGELTFDHGSGNEPFTAYEHDLRLGNFYAQALRHE
jgi:hypothetical protein